ncbi:MAG: class I SAM-dependent methyltransferase [Planctomycetota bacterium]
MMRFDGGSFRDRSARVLVRNEGVFRLLTADGLDTWRQVSRTPCFKRLMSEERLVETRELSRDEIEQLDLPEDSAAILQHERIPFVSYPYEWSFGMLRQAALLHLEILTEALNSGLILKDASPYNVQFCGSRPVFIDIGSFVALAPDEPWAAYRQFCELMLFPLLLQAYRHVDFQSVLRGELEGVSARQFLRWLSWRDLLRPGVFSHGWLQATLERHTRTVSTSTVRDLQSSGFSTELIRRNVTKLTRLVERLDWKPEGTQWTNYRTALPHVVQDGEAKAAFVRSVCTRRRWPLVWDLGCNDGRFSRIAAETAGTVVAMDHDHGCVERLYRSLHEEHSTSILPLCVNLANLSPAMGWRGRERKRLEERGRPDLVLCLGLIHHLVIGHNIPLPEVIDWLASLGGEVVIEFPSKQDAMVQALMRNKRDQYPDYTLAQLELALSRSFEIRDRTTLPSGERTLLHAIPKASRPGAP